MKDITKQISLN